MKRTPLARRTPLRRTGGLRARSPKRAAEERSYSQARRRFLAERSRCQAALDGCSGAATDVHHMRGRDGARLLDEQWWAALCRPCHRYVTDHPEHARALGLAYHRNGDHPMMSSTRPGSPRGEAR